MSLGGVGNVSFPKAAGDLQPHAPSGEVREEVLVAERGEERLGVEKDAVGRACVRAWVGVSPSVAMKFTKVLMKT